MGVVQDKLDEQRAGIRYGCHVDLMEGEEPDGCVIDDGVRGDCNHGHRHKTREGCPYWRRVAG